MSVNGLLDERAKTHGAFENNARVAQRLRAFWREQPSWESMPEIQREALDQIAGKLSRIFSGQSTHRDHFFDVAGYAMLAANACPQPSPPMPPLRHNGVHGADGNYHIAVDN